MRIIRQIPVRDDLNIGLNNGILKAKGTSTSTLPFSPTPNPSKGSPHKRPQLPPLKSSTPSTRNKFKNQMILT
ncbi:hypothetical protein L1987_43620 [Smallanthus sonchifolius]|uniref:Uncharacterized protein n=1 Tax=Smallanthus sonchifolius TaxID=185202 RepID=A0ACB9GMU8_9ASTR|nr:hypothetical protein L1987_43620 [Smallanthus sonchifolius]